MLLSLILVLSSPTLQPFTFVKGDDASFSSSNVVLKKLTNIDHRKLEVSETCALGISDLGEFAMLQPFLDSNGYYYIGGDWCDYDSFSGDVFCDFLDPTTSPGIASNCETAGGKLVGLDFNAYCPTSNSVHEYFNTHLNPL